MYVLNLAKSTILPNSSEQDNDDVCTICKNMVTEARDTLRSNETQEELKEVFEGSCALIPIKVYLQWSATIVTPSLGDELAKVSL